MEQRLKKKVLPIEGMTCTGCELRIENALNKLDGVVEAEAFVSNSNVYVTYDAGRVSLEQITSTIEKLGYGVKNGPGAGTLTTGKSKAAEDNMTVKQLLALGIILLALYLIINNTVGFNFVPEVNQYMGYGILFVVGLLTSLHCLAMCGGINLSQCLAVEGCSDRPAKLAQCKPSLLYNGGRVVSYTVIGGIVGALGSGISFSGAAKGSVAIICGIFMILMGLNMLKVFPWLRKLVPHLPKALGNQVQRGKGRYGPFYVGLLNGFMPCGPLQAMQLYALGTGSFAAGALSMLVFSLGTVPLMFGLGAVSSVLSGKFTRKMMKASAVLVIVLGVVMANRGLALSGVTLPGVPFGTNGSYPSSNVATIQDGVQVVTTKLYPGSYEPIVVQRGIPVKWTIKAQKGDINGCNNEIIIPRFNLGKKLAVGDNVIEFTPTETGTFAYSCWMGMIRSRIMVVEDLNNFDAGNFTGSGAEDDYLLPSGCSCCQVNGA